MLKTIQLDLKNQKSKSQFTEAKQIHNTKQKANTNQTDQKRSTTKQKAQTKPITPPINQLWGGAKKKKIETQI